MGHYEPKILESTDKNLALTIESMYKTRDELTEMGFTDANCIFQLSNKELIDLDPYDIDNLTPGQKSLVIKESVSNIWYYLSRVHRVIFTPTLVLTILKMEAVTTATNVELFLKDITK